MDSIIEKVELLFEASPLLGLKFDESIKSETQYELLNNICYFSADHPLHWELVASRLSPFFESVILCKNSRVIDLYFQNKKIEHPIWSIDLIWPQSDYLSVLKTETRSFMKKVFDEIIFDEKKHSTFLVNLGVVHDQDFKMILVSSTAEPWLNLKIQTLKSALERLDFAIQD